MGMLEQFRKYIAQIQAETGLDPTNIARRAGLSASTINKPLQADYDGNPPSLKTIDKLQDHFNIPFPGSRIATSETTRRQTSTPQGSLSTLGFDYADKLPVVGGARGGDLQTIFFNQDNPIDFVPRPPRLVGNRAAFAVYVVGDSMRPKFVAGQTLFVDPNRPPVSGSYVVIEGFDATAIVKRFISWSDAGVVVEELHPHERRFTVATPEIKGVYRVVGSDEP